FPFSGAAWLTVGHNKSETKSRLSPQHAPRRRPTVTSGQTVRIKTGCGSLYVTINEDEEGICEVFTTIGKAGGCAGAFSEATARLISLALRSGVEPKQVVKQLRGIRCPHPIWQDGQQVLSCPDAIAQVLEQYLQNNGVEEKTESEIPSNPHFKANPAIAGAACPECGGILVEESGCNVCVECGYSRCG
ncbi:MAG TPA: TSCPD domain-containing protein, partial [Firmicutes bacterium]|nr:TSCPD domain-containing protein [Bacillota bacterium]